MAERYTEKSYWENYYRKAKIDREQIESVCGHYDHYWDQLVESCCHPPRSIIEIGAYPGRYIAYLAARYGLEATALDYNSDRKKIEEAFQTMGVDRYEIIQADFFLYEPDHQFDLIISNGFVEHFENYDEVLDRHYKYLAPGGAMLVMIPNKRYLRKWYDYLCDYPNLIIHNLKAMKLSVFRKFAERNGLEIAFLGYLGGFSYNVHQKLNWLQQQIYRIVRLVFRKLNPIIEEYPNRFFSSSILGIFKKKS